MRASTHHAFATSPENPAKFLLCWHGHAIGYFTIGGLKQWEPLHPAYEKLFVSTEKEQLPMFLNNLSPEGWLKEHLHYDLQSDYIRSGRRYLSNLTIFRSNGTLDIDTKIDSDKHLSTLAAFVDDQGIFQGDFKAIRGMNDEPAFEASIITYWQDRRMPRFSGAELKLPTTLNEDGSITPALDTPFNIITKYPGQKGYESLGVNEFLGMRMARAAGLDTPNFALVDQGDNLPPVYMIERYDIPDAVNGENEWLITQDFCTLMGLRSDEKAKCTVEKIGKKIVELSEQAANPTVQKNLEDLFKRTAFSWVINDGDMHQKNISLLYRFDPATKTITNISFAPTYDTTTDVFSNREGVSQCLQMAGKRNNFKMKDFVRLAESLGIYKGADGKTDAALVERTVHHIAGKAAQTAVEFANNKPEFVQGKPWTYDIDVLTAHVVDRARALGAETPAWDSQAVWRAFPEKNAYKRKIDAERSDYYDPDRPRHRRPSGSSTHFTT